MEVRPKAVAVGVRPKTVAVGVRPKTVGVLGGTAKEFVRHDECSGKV